MSTAQRLRRHAGFTLIELMVAAAIAAVVSAVALQLLITQVRFGRATTDQADVADRARLAREIITRDVQMAGHYWAHQGGWNNGSNNLDTGTFGAAALGSTLTNWPKFPITGTNSAAGPDAITLIVPDGEIIGASASATSLNYKCRQGAAIRLSAPSTTEPAMIFPGAGSNWGGANRVVMATGNNVTLLTALTSYATGTDGIVLGQVASCAQGGSTDAGTLPKSFSVFPVAAVTYVVTADSTLMRCVSKASGAGPIGINAGNAAADARCKPILKGIEDLQFRYVFSSMTIDDATSNEYRCDDPGVFTNYISVPLAVDPAVAACLGNNRLLKDATAALPYVRFVSVDVGVISRSLRGDTVSFRNRGKLPSFSPRFDRSTVGAADSLRREAMSWRAVTPNAYIF